MSPAALILPITVASVALDVHADRLRALAKVTTAGAVVKVADVARKLALADAEIDAIPARIASTQLAAVGLRSAALTFAGLA